MKASRTKRRLMRGNPFKEEKVHDPYRSAEKLREGTHCPQCGVRYQNGRWTWPKTSIDTLESQLCPACRRINDRYPAGELVVSGSFASSHRDEILARVRHVDEAERALHPLHRIMAIDERGSEIVISTTDIHLPHQIAHALEDAWAGTTKTHYDLAGYFTRVRWRRDD